MSPASSTGSCIKMILIIISVEIILKELLSREKDQLESATFENNLEYQEEKEET